MWCSLNFIIILLDWKELCLQELCTICICICVLLYCINPAVPPRIYNNKKKIMCLSFSSAISSPLWILDRFWIHTKRSGSEQPVSAEDISRVWLAPPRQASTVHTRHTLRLSAHSLIHSSFTPLSLSLTRVVLPLTNPITSCLVLPS